MCACVWQLHGADSLHPNLHGFWGSVYSCTKCFSCWAILPALKIYHKQKLCLLILRLNSNLCLLVFTIHPTLFILDSMRVSKYNYTEQCFSCMRRYHKCLPQIDFFNVLHSFMKSVLLHFTGSTTLRSEAKSKLWN